VSEPVITAPEAGGEIVREAGEAAAVQGVLGTPSVSQEHRDLASREAHGRELIRQDVDNLEGQVLTLAEGVVDALSLGLIRERGERADIRRDVFSKTALFGNIAGAALGLKVPGMPFGAVARVGEKAGRAAVKGLLREGSVLGRGVSEAASEAAIAGAWSAGHQVMDTIIEDKDFSAEALIDEIKLGGALGFGGGLILGTLPKLGTTRQVKQQGGLLAEDVGPVRSAWRDARKAYDDALNENAARIGAIKQMRQDGIINSFADDIIPQREAALREAQSAKKALDRFGSVDVLDASPGEYRPFQAARDRYFAAVDELDNLNRPFAHERAPVTDLNKPGSDTYSSAPRVDVSGEPSGVKTGAETPSAKRVDDTAVVDTPAYRDGPSPRATDPGVPDMPETSAKTVVREATPEELGALLPDKTHWDMMAGRRMRDMDLDDLTKGAKVVHPHPEAMAADNMLHGDFIDRPLLKLRNGYFMPQLTIEANPGYFSRKFPDVIDPAAKSQPPVAPLVKYAPEATSPKATVPDPKPGNLQDLNAAVEKLPLRDPATIVEEVPAARLNAAADAADAKAAKKAQRRLDAADHTVWDPSPEGRKVASRALLDEWVRGYESPRPSPGDRAAQRVQALMDDLHQMSGGRLDSASAIRMGRDAGIPASSHSFGGRMDQVWAMRRVGKMAALEARGKASGLRDGLKADLGALGLGVAVDPLVGLAARYFGFGGRIASAAGRLMAATGKAAETFLTTNRVRAVLASARNQAWEYSDRGPIEDPLERVEEIRRLAADPATVAARVDQAADDLRYVAPDFVEALKVKAQVQIAALAQEAPQVTYDSLGRPLNPPAGEMRRFLEFENALHDLGSILRSVEAGSVSPTQVKALQIGFPSAHAKLVGTMMSSPDQVRRLNRAKLRAMEAITGVPLSRSSDPMFIQRQAEAWVPPQPAPPPKAQAFNINPDGSPTPAQSTVAPGN
jgi:hypothetical protein